MPDQAKSSNFDRFKALKGTLRRAAVRARPSRRGRSRPREAALPLHAQRVRVLVATIRRALVSQTECAAPKGIPHRCPGARGRHASLEGLRKVVGRSDRRAHLGHRVVRRRGSISRCSGEGKVDRGSERGRREASCVAGRDTAELRCRCRSWAGGVRRSLHASWPDRRPILCSEIQTQGERGRRGPQARVPLLARLHA
jgi:hypothetical protein